MKNIAINPTIWQPTVFTSVSGYKNKTKTNNTSKDLVLKNNLFLGKEVTEMTLNTIKLMALDANDNESLVLGFNPQVLNLKGQRAGLFINASTGLQLSAGNYKIFRFYLDAESNSIKTSDRSLERISNLEYLDFKIEGGLHINNQESSEVVLSFDFVPFKFNKVFKILSDLISSSNISSNTFYV